MPDSHLVSRFRRLIDDQRGSVAALCISASLLTACVGPGYGRAGAQFSVSPRSYPTAKGSFDTPPRLTGGNNPYYPPEEALNGKPGKVHVAFTIAVDGRASDIQIIDATDKDFGDALVDAIRSWRFEPARKADMPVPSALNFTYFFCEPPPADDCHAL